ncbi:ATP-binding cassette domain-containing protein [Ruminiclostridium josui]|uniref:ATP-binding cassette domain-containing protein n=1 Tax=Ruminiclostridium josui TaxID=1499 RepID=UPI000466A6F5|nr:ATP-binding cassette domain-containing protein [Ruminiclostridium josui]
MEKIIKVSNLVKNYGAVEAVKNISFEVEKGSLFAFLGTNGAGKSTTIDILSTLITKNSGSVVINGWELGKDDKKIREDIGIVFQNSVLDNLLTVRENLSIRGSFYGLRGSALKKLQVDSVNQQTNGVLNGDKLSYLINSWILGGLLSITTLTSTLGALGAMVNDRYNRIIMDFKSSPISAMIYPISCVITSFIVGTIISVISFVVYGGYIYFSTGYFFSIGMILKCLGLICLSAMMSAALMGFMVSFFSTISAYSSASLIVGTTIGFLNGLYVPMGALPETIQSVIKCLPFGHVASLFRRVLMQESLDLCFKNAPISVRDSYTRDFGVILDWNGSEISSYTSIAFTLGVLLISLLLFFINFRRKKQEI